MAFNTDAGLCLFYGEEAYKKRLYKEKLRRAIAGSGSINYAYFEGQGINLSAVYDSVVTLPFFAERRLVIVENSGLFKAKKGADTAASSGRSGGMLEKIINDLPATTCLAFFENEINKTLRAYKLISKKGVVTECSKDGQDTVVRWLARGFDGAGKKVKQSTLELLVERTGTGYDRLRQEFEKILGYAGSAEIITDEMVLAVTGEDTESRIFDMLGAMSTGNTKEVLDRYYELLANKEHPLFILTMVRRQFRNMLQIAELIASGLSDDDIAGRLNLRRFIVKRTRGYLRHISRKRIEEILAEIADTDEKIKTGYADERIGVELLLIRCASQRPGAENE